MLRFFLLLLLTLLPLWVCAMQPQKQSSNISAALSSYYPEMKFQQVSPTPVAGVYEVIVDNGEILYFVPASGHILLGELWSADAQNLTRESKNKRMSAKLNAFPLDQAIKIGDGPNQVIEVTDPDCPFCRQGSDFFAGRDDVSRYVFLFPLDNIHPQAAAKARFILAAKDQELAYEEVFSGEYDSLPVPEANDHGLLALHRKVAKEIGINGTPQFWINGQHVSGFNPKQFDALLNK